MSTELIARLAISALVIVGFGGVLIAWMIWPPKQDSTMLASMVGALVSGYALVLTSWFKKD